MAYLDASFVLGVSRPIVNQNSVPHPPSLTVRVVGRRDGPVKRLPLLSGVSLLCSLLFLCCLLFSFQRSFHFKGRCAYSQFLFLLCSPSLGDYGVDVKMLSIVKGGAFLWSILVKMDRW